MSFNRVPRGLRQYANCGSVPDILVGSIRYITGYTMAFIDPVAEIDQLAAFAAERLPALRLRPFHQFPAGRAGHGLYCGSGGHVIGTRGMAIAQGQMAQQASPNSTLFSVCLARVSTVEKFRKRAVKRCRPPLNSAK